jgi:hypothetical protein
VVYYTNELDVTAQFTAAGAVKMRVGWSEAEVLAAAWEAFAVEKAAPIGEGEADGEKTLFVELQDQCGLVRRYSAALTLDTKAPVGARVDVDAIEGLDGRQYVKNSGGQVTVRLSVDDELSGVDVFRLTIDAVPSAEDYDDIPGSRVYTTGLGSEQKAHTLYVQYRDRAGNESEVASAEAVVDYEPPVVGAPPVSVTNGVSDGTKTVVYDDTAILAFDVPAGDAAQYALAFVSGGGSWEPFLSQVPLSMQGRPRGDVPVFVRFRDNAKNETQEYQATFSYETQGRVEGKVRLEGGGDPTGVEVLISTAGASAVHPDINGDFSILGVERGSYTVKFTAAGHEEAFQVAVVKAGAVTALSNVTLKRSRGTLAGTFTLAGASSHAGILVKVAEAGLSVETGTDGSFAVQNLVAQQYTVSASMYGYTPVTGQAVTVPAGGVGTAAGGELAVAISASISGTAACEVGSCASASVALNGTRFDGSAVSGAATADGGGAFSITNLAAGEYTVTVSKTGYKAGQAVVSVSPGAAKSAGVLALTAERGSVAGSVSAGGTAREGAVLTLSGTSSIGVAVNETTTSGAGGAFRFGSVLVGSYTLTAALADFTSVSQGVAVAAGAESNAGILNLAVNPGSVSGSVSLEGGAPGSGVTVSVEGGGASTVTSGAGAYTLTGVTPGTRALLFTKGTDYEQYRLGGVEVAAGGSTTAPAVMLLRARGAITGTVVLVGGADPTGVTVMVEGGQAVTSTDSSGVFRLDRVPVGSNYTVTAIKEGYVRATKTGLSVSANAETPAGTLTLAKLVGDFRIDDGSGVTGDRAATLDLSTLNNPAQVRASEDVTFSGGAQAYEAWQAAYPFNITSAGDGTKTIFMQYKDTGGQEHGPFSASILLDTTDPVITAVLINDGAALTNSKIVGVGIDATDGAVGSGIVSMQMRNDDQFNDGDPWPDYEMDINTWTLAEPTTNVELDKDVWVRLKDAAGNIGAAVKGTIRLDTLAPTGTLTLNGGDEWTTSTQVVAEVVGASADTDAMALSNVPGGTTVFTSFQTSGTWFVAPGDSATEKLVYLRLRDAAGNTSLETNDGIKLDQTAPPIPSLPVSSVLTNDTTPALAFGAVSDNVSAVTYEAELSDQSDFSNLLAVTLVGTTVTPVAALSDGDYYFHVRAMDAAGNVSQYGTALAFEVDATRPSAPENLSGPASPTNNLRPTLSWDAVSDAVSYRVERSLDPTFQVGVQSSTVYTTSWRPAGNMQDNATINWRVFATDAAGNESLPSTASSFSTDATPPGVPVLLSPGDGAVVSTAVVTLAWQAAPGATRYRLQAATDSGFYSIVLDSTLEELSQDTSPQDGTYYWHVAAIDDAGNTSLYSAAWSVAKDTTPPNIPVPQAPQNEARLSKKRPVFQWGDESASGAASYVVFIKDKNGTLVFDPPPEPAANSYTPTADLQDALSPFSWTVRSKDSRGNVSQASTQFSLTVDTTGPAGPSPWVDRTSPDGDIDPNNNLKLRTPPLVFLWPKLTVASPDTGVSYHLEVIDDGGTTLIDEWGIPQPSSGSSVSFATTSAGITSGKYCWHVQAVDDLGNIGAFSSDFDPGANRCTGGASTAAIFDVDNTAPNSPEPLSPTPYSYVTTTTPQFTWIPEAQSGADKYELRIYNVTNGGIHLTKQVGPPGTLGDYTLAPGEALTDGKTYAFSMRAFDSVGNASEESSRNQFTVDVTSPNEPVSLAVNGLTADPAYVNTPSPSLSWQGGGSPDIDHFEIKIKTDNQCATLGNLVQAAGVTSNAFLAAALNDDMYFWCIRAVDRAGLQSDWVLGNRINVDTLPPPSPRFNSVSQTILDLSGNAACGQDNQFSIGLSVTSGSDPSFDHYDIRGGHSAAGGAPCAQLAEFTAWTGAPPFVFNLNADYVNTLQVRAVDKAGNASDVDFVIITEDSTLPVAPSNINVIEGNGRTMITWNPSTSSDVAGYKLYYGPSPNPPYNGTFAPEGLSPINVGNVTSFGLSSLVNNSTFFVTVTAYDKTQDPAPHESPAPTARSVLPNPVTMEPASTYKGYTATPFAFSVHVSNSVAYIADSNNLLEIADVSNPAAPVHLGSLDLGASASRVTVLGDHAYVVAGLSMRVIDVRDPTTPIQRSSYLPPACAIAGIYDVFVQGRYAYLPCGTAGLAIVDVNDPANPSQVGTVDTSGTASGVHVNGRYAYLADSESGLQVVDCQNPALPTVVGTRDTSGSATGVYVSDPYAFVADGNEGLKIINVSDPADPWLEGSYNTPVNAQQVVVSGGLAFVADGPGGVIVVDVSQIGQERLAGSYLTAQAIKVALQGTYLFVADSWEGMLSLAVVTVTSPVQKASTSGQWTNDLAVSGSNAFVSDRNSNRLHVLSLRSPPVQVGSVVLGAPAFGVAVQSQFAYVAAQDAGLVVVDVSRANNPIVVGSRPETGSILGVAVSGKYAVTAGSTFVHVVDVSNPANPLITGSYNHGDTARDIAMSGRYAYAVFDDKSLRIVDISNPALPSLAGSVVMDGSGTGVAVSGRYVYVSHNGSSGVTIVDAVNPATPVKKGTFSSGMDQTQGVFVSGPFAYAADFGAGTKVIDVSNPDQPVLKANYDTTGWAYGVFVEGAAAYVADDFDGVKIISLEP